MFHVAVVTLLACRWMAMAPSGSWTVHESERRKSSKEPQRIGLLYKHTGPPGEAPREDLVYKKGLIHLQ